ncbi:site-specific integrase [Brevibacillus brevis]|nr:site-specific integrase [Brevibacillus brevis]
MIKNPKSIQRNSLVKKRGYHSSKYLDHIAFTLYIEELQNLNFFPSVDRKEKIRQFIRFLSEHQKRDFDNIHAIIGGIKEQHVAQYREYLLQCLQKKEINRVNCMRKFRVANQFVQFMISEKVIKLAFEPLSLILPASPPLPRIRDQLSPILVQFNLFLIEQGYEASVLLKHAKVFYKYVSCRLPRGEDDNADLRFLTMSLITDYESFLSKRVMNEEILRSSAYRMLLSVKHFLNFLFQVKTISFKYSIPHYLRATSKRSNEYVSQQKIHHLLTMILSRSKNKYRDMSIVLLLVDLGCRPIELANIRTSDISFSESTVILYSKKSGQRKMKISKVVMDIIKRYIKVRGGNELCDSLFLKQDGRPLHSDNISGLFRRFTNNITKQHNINAKALRHTYITNLLDNGNDFDKVSKAAGHLHWVSTLYYFHRSKKRILENTLPFNPIQELL